MSTAQVLVVDDQHQNLVAMRGLLESSTWEVVCVSTAREALHRLLNDDFAAILLDVQMPEMDGFELARLIRDRPRFRQTPIIFMTAIHQSDAYARQAYALGAVDYLFKPLIPEIVRSKIRFFVDFYLLHRERLEQEQRENERRLADLTQQNERLRFEYRMRNLFLANLSHELRTPLNAIVGFADLLGADPVLASSDFARMRAYSDYISRGADRLLQVLRNMLEFSNLESGTPQREEFDVETLLREVRGALESLARRRDIAVVLSVDAAARRAVADAEKVRQVVFNYLDNAVKFSPRGSAVQVNALSDGDRGLYVEVVDEGESISVKDRARLFVEFGKLEGRLAEDEGVGLGLALSRRLTELQGGSVGVRAAGPSGGNVFFAVFPKASRESAVRAV